MPLKSPRTKENLAPVGFEPTTSGLDLPVLYRLSYEASTGAGRGNLGSEFEVSITLARLNFKRITIHHRTIDPSRCLIMVVKP